MLALIFTPAEAFMRVSTLQMLTWLTVAASILGALTLAAIG